MTHPTPRRFNIAPNIVPGQPFPNVLRWYSPQSTWNHVLTGLALGSLWVLGGWSPVQAQSVSDDLPAVAPAPIEIPVNIPPTPDPNDTVGQVLSPEPVPPSESQASSVFEEAFDDRSEERSEDSADIQPLGPRIIPVNEPPVSIPTRSAPSRSPAQVRDWYQLNRGDRIQIEVFDAPEYSGEHVIFADGTVSLPLVGTFQLRGLTLAQAETLIANRLAQVLRRPFTTIRLLEERPINLAVTGEVYEPGAYTVGLSDVNGVPTVTNAIQLAKGIRLTADIRNVEVRRTNPYTARIDEIFVVDLWRLLEEGDLSQDLVLEDGDSIVIPEADELDYEEVNVLAYANISPEEMTVNVVGEVDAPGAIQVQPSTPLHQAILAAGGFNNRAKKKRVLLIRLNPDGTVTNQEIEIDFEQGIDSANNPPLRPFDTIVVGRSNFTKVTDAVGRAFSPFSQFLGILRIFGL